MHENDLSRERGCAPAGRYVHSSLLHSQKGLARGFNAFRFVEEQHGVIPFCNLLFLDLRFPVMRILLWSDHTYPAGGRIGTGWRANSLATGGAAIVHDQLAKGLAELNHDVFYRLRGAQDELPSGVRRMNGSVDVDIVHHGNSRWVQDADFLRLVKTSGAPWVATCHADPARWGIDAGGPPDNWIFVSRTIAESYGKSRYVLNGIDPADYLYSETKHDYFAFMCNFRNAGEKGLDIALSLSRSMGFKLVVAGPCVGRDYTTEAVERECASDGAAYIGDVRGRRKAEFLAGARALLFPTRVNEAFGLVIAEALMSGTPVISSPMGACRELVSP